MKRNVLAALLALALVLPLFAGPGQQTGTQTSGGGNPVLSLTTMYFSAEVPGTPVLDAKMEELTGYKVEVNWIPTTAYEDKINTMMASNSLTQMVVPLNLKSTSYINAVNDGLFWALDDYIKDYPNLMKMGNARYNNVKLNGKIMGIPRGRDLVRQGIIYRQDWAEEMGINGQPTTLAQVDQMIRNFAARPGARYGLVMGCAGVNPGIPEAVDYLAAYMGAPWFWGFNKQGQFTHAWLTDEYTQAVEQIRTWYADGLINRNFIEINVEDAKRILNTEEAGFLFVYTDDIQNRFNDLYIKNPQARLWYAFQLDNRTFGTAGFNTTIAISTGAVKDETLLRHCLSFINNLGKPEWQDVIGIGLEGEHYTMVDGFATQSETQNAKFAATASQYGQINCFGGVVLNSVPFKRIPAVEAITIERLKYVDTCLMDPTTPFVSPTSAQIGLSDLDPIRVDAINRYIMGVIDKAAYQAAQQRWLQAGGAQVTKEFGDQIAANR